MRKTIAICGGMVVVALTGIFVVNALIEARRGYGFINSN